MSYVEQKKSAEEEEIDEPQTDEEIHDKLKQQKKTYKSFKALLFMTMNLCLSSFYFGYNLAYFGSFDFKVIYSIFNISMESKVAEGLLQGCIPIGGGIGALLTFPLLKNVSRRRSLFVINVVALIIGFLLLIPNDKVLFFGRFMQGICVGLYSAITPLLIKQFAPTEISGTLGAMNQLFIAFGVFFACFFQYILMQISPQERHWEMVFGFTILTVLLQTILLKTQYRFQTPKYLLEKDRQQECLRVLEWIYLEEYVNQILDKKKQDLENTSQSHNKGEKSYSKKRIFLAIHLAVLQQFVGINSVVGYGSQIAGQIMPKQKNLIPVILNFEQVIAAFVTSYLLSKLGRKTILQIGTIAAVFSLVLISVGFMVESLPESGQNALIIGGLVIFMANFGLSLGPIVWLYIPEIVEPEIVPFSTLSNWASAGLVMILFPIMQKKLGNPGPLFIFFGLWCVISFCVNSKLVVQTKGKSEKQIYNEFKNN